MLKKMKISSQLKLLNAIGISFLLLLVVSGYTALTDIGNNINKIKTDNKLIEEQTLVLNNIIKSIKQNITLTKMEAFESIVAKKPVRKNTNYLNALKNTNKDIDNFKKFLNKHKKNKKSLHEAHASIKKDFKTYRLILEVLQEEIEEDEEYGREILADEVRPIEAKLFVLINKLTSTVSKKFDAKFDAMSKYINKTEKISKNSITTSITIGTIATILFLFVVFLIAKNINNSINSFRDNLLKFFKYLNKETNSVVHLKESNTEIGYMSKEINKNIDKIKISIEEDKKVIEDTVVVLDEFVQGNFSKRVNATSNNPAIKELTNHLNEMGVKIEKNINRILIILEQYTQGNYVQKVSTNGVKEHLLKLANDINSLGSSITQMLVSNKQSGLALDSNSDLLLKNVNILNINSNEAAASLEETSAALEQITSTIVSSTENVIRMADNAQKVNLSANQGQELARQTTTAMDEIDDQVEAISEAISIIDQISFQTNILSLNAAVEAATAGEAGKGFAVVAQEVRNLASRSAEAANEIKTLVENAMVKTDEGKSIADKMTDGYNELNKNISETIGIIKDVESASMEQKAGIEQINDAVSKLDQKTQQNASIAGSTYDISIKTDKMAKFIVTEVDKKEFDGKLDIDKI